MTQPTTDVVSFVLETTVKRGQLDALRAVMNDLVESTEQEPGTLVYEWFLSSEETRCHVYERYVDSDALLAHAATFGAQFAERLLACVEPTRLTVYGTPSEAARIVLDGLGAAYLQPFGGFAR